MRAFERSGDRSGSGEIAGKFGNGRAAQVRPPPAAIFEDGSFPCPASTPARGAWQPQLGVRLRPPRSPAARTDQSAAAAVQLAFGPPPDAPALGTQEVLGERTSQGERLAQPLAAGNRLGAAPIPQVELEGMPLDHKAGRRNRASGGPRRG
ncbi:MAG TPA: hypothetical protein VGC54_04240, partial [Planctomycetota bacterium]